MKSMDERDRARERADARAAWPVRRTTNEEQSDDLSAETTATERIASELRSSMGGGILVAGARTLTVRSPIVVGMICSRQGGGDADIHTEGGQAELDTDEVAGVAVRDSLTGIWTYSSATWGTLDGNDGSHALQGGTFDDGDLANLVDDVHSFDDLGEDGIAGAIARFIEEVVVDDVDEEFVGRRIGLIAQACHRDGAARVR